MNQKEGVHGDDTCSYTDDAKKREKEKTLKKIHSAIIKQKIKQENLEFKTATLARKAINKEFKIT